MLLLKLSDFRFDLANGMIADFFALTFILLASLHFKISLMMFLVIGSDLQYTIKSSAKVNKFLILLIHSSSSKRSFIYNNPSFSNSFFFRPFRFLFLLLFQVFRYLLVLECYDLSCIECYRLCIMQPLD